MCLGINIDLASEEGTTCNASSPGQEYQSCYKVYDGKSDPARGNEWAAATSNVGEWIQVSQFSVVRFLDTSAPLPWNEILY